MKHILFLGLIAFCSLPLNLGCVASGKQDLSSMTPAQQQQEISFFVKTATRIVLHELKPPATDAEMLRAYLVTGKDLLSEEGPDLNTLRELVKNSLPQQYKVFGLTVIDVIERYVAASLPRPDENAIARNKLIVAGLEGALIAVDEYISIESQK